MGCQYSDIDILSRARTTMRNADSHYCQNKLALKYEQNYLTTQLLEFYMSLLHLFFALSEVLRFLLPVISYFSSN